MQSGLQNTVERGTKQFHPSHLKFLARQIKSVTRHGNDVIIGFRSTAHAASFVETYCASAHQGVRCYDLGAVTELVANNRAMQTKNTVRIRCPVEGPYKIVFGRVGEDSGLTYRIEEKNS